MVPVEMSHTLVPQNPTTEQVFKYLSGQLQENEPTPLYLQLANGFAKLIELGKLPPGYRLLSERKIVDNLSICRRTVRAALGHLIERKLLVSKQGRGNFVLLPPTKKLLRILIPERFQSDHWQSRPFHYDWIHRGEEEVNCEVHYVYTPTLEKLQQLLQASTSDGDGVLIFRPPQAWVDYLEAIPPSAKATLPFLVVNRLFVNPKIHFTSAQHFQIAQTATGDLLAAGHRRVALIAGDPVNSYIQNALEGYQNALAGAGISYETGRVLFLKEKERKEPVGKELAEFVKKMDATAVLVDGSSLTLAFEKCIEQLRIDVPRALSVMMVTEEVALSRAKVNWSAYVDPTQAITTQGLRHLCEIIRGNGAQVREIFSAVSRVGSTLSAPPA